MVWEPIQIAYRKYTCLQNKACSMPNLFNLIKINLSLYVRFILAND